MAAAAGGYALGQKDGELAGTGSAGTGAPSSDAIGTMPRTRS